MSEQNDMTPCHAGETPVSSALRRNAGILATILIFAVLIFDQTLKIWIKTHFYLGEDHEITSWFHIKFIENNGMAFGLQLWNKLFLTGGRIIAVAILCWLLVKICRIKCLRTGFILAIALITAGAAGNIFDCVFYGQIFNNPMPPETAVLFPPDGGYAPWMEGRVVDMFYFPFCEFYWPEWIPGIGGTYYEFFAYIFNVADASICVGVALLIIFYSRDFSAAYNTLAGKKEKNDSDDETGSRK